MIDLFDQSIDLVADTAAHDQRDVRIELGVLEPQGGADRERGSHDELQAQTIDCLALSGARIAALRT